MKSLRPLLLLSLALPPAHAADRAPAASPSKPNVLFIIVDDLRPELGAYGHSEIKSPHIDALAKSGLVFDRAYCQQAVCSPTRTSLMTGARPDTTKVWDLVTHFRKALPDVVTLQQLFKNNGYFVQGMGKVFHGGYDDAPSWSVPAQVPKAVPYALAENVALNQRQFETEPDDPAPARQAQKKTDSARRARDDTAASKFNTRGPAFEGADVPDNTFQDGKVAELAITTLQGFSNKKEPFFLAVGFIKPHLPFVSPKKYWDLYDPAKIDLAPNPFPASGAPEYAVLPGSEMRAYAGIPEGPIPDDLARQLKHGYYAAISYTDAQIGLVLAELDRLGLRENTIVVLWGDHGWKLGEHGAWCKHTNTENDTNAPLIISAPGMKHAGEHSRALVEFVDVYPTLAELAGLPLPAHLEGLSVKPLLENPTRPWKQAAFSQYPRPNHGQPLMGYSMRTDRYRLTVWVARDDHTKIDAIELYDHEADPLENTNIAKLPANTELVERLLTQWRAGWKGALPAVAKN